MGQGVHVVLPSVAATVPMPHREHSAPEMPLLNPEGAAVPRLQRTHSVRPLSMVP